MSVKNKALENIFFPDIIQQCSVISFYLHLSPFTWYFFKGTSITDQHRYPTQQWYFLSDCRGLWVRPYMPWTYSCLSLKPNDALVARSKNKTTGTFGGPEVLSSCWWLPVVVIAFTAMSSLSSYFSVISPLVSAVELDFVNALRILEHCWTAFNGMYVTARASGGFVCR